MRNLLTLSCTRNSLQRAILTLAVVCLALATASATTISFSTFVSSSSIATATSPSPNTSVIGFTYAGNKFVGSLYPSDNRLYSTNLSGGSVALFGTVPGASGEVVLAASLGLGGFAAGNIYAGSGANGQIYVIPNSGGTGTLFTTLPTGSGVVRGIMFDPGSTFGGDMLVSTTSGNIYKVTSTGVASLLVSFGVDTEGMDVVGSGFGPYAGYLLTASEGNCQLNLVSPGGVATPIGCISVVETVAYVPDNLGSGNPALEGFYAANYAVDIQKADPSQFTQPFAQFLGRNLLGDAVVTAESSHLVYDVHWNGTSFDINSIGSYPNQPEDGIFVTAQRIHDVTAPEPSTMMAMATGLAGLVGSLRRKLFR